MTAPARSIAHYVEEISKRWRRSVDDWFAIGRLLNEAKNDLEHGEFTTMVNERLPFGPRSSQMFMKIAADQRLANPKHVSLLPADWGAVYQLTKLDDSTLERRFADGTITPEATRAKISTVVKQERRKEREVEWAREVPPGEYAVILEDFEWDFEVRSEAGKDRHASNHYETATAHTAAEIVAATADRFQYAAADCVLFQWTPVPHLAIGMEVMRLRGFAYKSHVVWLKEAGITGYWFIGWHELLLVGTRGKIVAPAPGMQWPSAMRSPSGEHSAKPEWQYRLIKEYFPHQKKLELNARGTPYDETWEVWGNEAREAAE